MQIADSKNTLNLRNTMRIDNKGNVLYVINLFAIWCYIFKNIKNNGDIIHLC